MALKAVWLATSNSYWCDFFHGRRYPQTVNQKKTIGPCVVCIKVFNIAIGNTTKHYASLLQSIKSSDKDIFTLHDDEKIKPRESGWLKTIQQLDGRLQALDQNLHLCFFQNFQSVNYIHELLFFQAYTLVEHSENEALERALCVYNY